MLPPRKGNYLAKGKQLVKPALAKIHENFRCQYHLVGIVGDHPGFAMTNVSALIPWQMQMTDVQI